MVVTKIRTLGQYFITSSTRTCLILPVGRPRLFLYYDKLGRIIIIEDFNIHVGDSSDCTAEEVLSLLDSFKSSVFLDLLQDLAAVHLKTINHNHSGTVYYDLSIC